MTRIFAILMLGAFAVNACTIPVFRYALDRWPADPYALTVPKVWIESAAGEKFLTDLDKRSINLRIVGEEEPEYQNKLFLPGPEMLELWTGKEPPADLKQLAKLLDSPARQQLAKLILNGASAVWVQVDSGNKEADDALFNTLSKRLEYLKNVAEIPPQDPFDPESRLGPGPELKVEFGLVRIRRNDPAEAAFVEMLAGSRKEKVWKDGMPFAAPVFGRGRTLGAWTAEDLDDEGIDEVCMYLLGACSCQVKRQNPGWDLMMDLDWDTKLMEVAMANDVELASADETSEAPEPPTNEPPAPAKEEPAPTPDEPKTTQMPEVVKIEPNPVAPPPVPEVMEEESVSGWFLGAAAFLAIIGIVVARKQ